MDDDLSDLLRRKALEEIGITEDLGKKNQDDCNLFRELCGEKIDYSNESSEDINNHEKFITAVDQLNCQFPFLQYKKLLASCILTI